MKLSLCRLHGSINTVVSECLNEDLVIHSIKATVIAYSAVFVECNKLAGILEVIERDGQGLGLEWKEGNRFIFSWVWAWVY